MKSPLSVLSRWAATFLIFSFSVVAAIWVWQRYETVPWTRDGHVRADVVRVSSDVGGFVTEVLVHDNQHVQPGQLLLVLDRPRYEAALAQVDADILSKQAALDQARREVKRDLTLGDLVPTETHEQNMARVRTLAANLSRTQAERRVALLNVQRTAIRATVNGVITNLDLHPGDYLAPGAQILALVDTDTLRVEGYFEETKIGCIRPGNRALIRLMGEQSRLIGHVDSIAAGIADDQRSDTHNLLAAVQPTFSWVRLAQRIPVRVHIDHIPPGIQLIAGRTATVMITSENCQ